MKAKYERMLNFGRALPIRVVMGGLRPGTTIPMTEEAKLEIGDHWTHVHEATGLPFELFSVGKSGLVIPISFR